MSDCSAVREQMPVLLGGGLESASRREETHQHIESCVSCSGEWLAYQQTWSLLGDLPEVEPPPYLRERFLTATGLAAGGASIRPTVIPFRQSKSAKWLAQAAAVAVMVGGSYYAGHRTSTIRVSTGDTQVSNAIPVAQPIVNISESRTLKTSEVSPVIEGRPDIENVQLVQIPGTDQARVSFDLTSHTTVIGSTTDKSMVRLLSYLNENEDRLSGSSQSRPIDFLQQVYGGNGKSNPEIEQSLARVLKSDEHQGVRIKAAETLKVPSMTLEIKDALISALKDPNPEVRIAAIEKLEKLAETGNQLGSEMIDTLAAKSHQEDENPYVRIKAAEVLGKIH